MYISDASPPQMDIRAISGIPEEQLKTRRVVIKMPTKNSMQSGTNNLHRSVSYSFSFCMLILHDRVFHSHAAYNFLFMLTPFLSRLVNQYLIFFIHIINACDSAIYIGLLYYRWKIAFNEQERWENPLMGWASTADPLSNTEVSDSLKVQS